MKKGVRLNDSFITFVVRVFFGACSGDFHRSLRSGLERTSPTLEPKCYDTACGLQLCFLFSLYLVSFPPRRLPSPCMTPVDDM